MVCAFSGHRPQRLPWGFDEGDPRCVALKCKLDRELRALVDQGADTFLCGMARGCDVYFAEAALELRRSLPHLKVWAVLPCGTQANAWEPADQARYRGLCQDCDQVILLQEQYTPDCMRRRNQWMVDRADCLMTVYDGGPGGTGWTVRCAKRLGLLIVPLWL